MIRLKKISLQYNEAEMGWKKYGIALLIFVMHFNVAFICISDILPNRNVSPSVKFRKLSVALFCIAHHLYCC